MPTKISKKSVTADVVAMMESLGVYRPEYDGMISVYVDTLIDYRRQLATYKRLKYQCMVKTAQGVKKSPLVTTIEAARRDLLTYGEALGLTPRSNRKMMEGQYNDQAAEPESGDDITRRLEALLGMGDDDD